MSIEVTLHPKRAGRDDLRKFLQEQGYLPCEHLWDWPKGSLNFHWYEYADYLSYDGVEATIYKSSSDEHQLGPCEWALHTRTRSSASPADKDQQDKTIRLARTKFGGNFYNDWHGKNRYTRRESDHRDAPSRGIYLTYKSVTNYISAVKYSVSMTEGLKVRTGDKKIEELMGTIDPMRVLYNALVPFYVAIIENFFSRCFKILLRYDAQAQEKLKQQSRKVELGDVIAIKNGDKNLEDVVAEWYSFQNIDSIHKAFSEWLGIDFWKIIRTKKEIRS